ncbi:MAG TPA: DNA polymerase I [Armatimonadota bacterium]
MAEERPRLLLVDGNSLLHRAFHALPPLMTSDGRPTNAVYGLATMLVSLLEQHPPEAALVAFDAPGPTHRHLAYTEYKATRREPDEALVPQFSLAREMVSALGLEQAEISGWEADDLLAGLAAQGAAQGYEVLVVTGDRDMVQLVDDHVSVLATIRGVADTRTYDRAQVLAEYGLRPDQIADFKGLAGDTSDNIPGVKGIGKQTALALLQQWDNVENLLAHLDEVTPPRARTALAAQPEQALLSKQLATLEPAGVPITFDPEQFAFHGFDRDRLRPLLLSLEFGKLWQRLEKISAPAEPAPEIAGAEVGQTLRKARAQGHMFLAGAWEGSELVGLAVAADADSATYLPLVKAGGDTLFPEAATASLTGEVAAALTDPDLGKRGVDLKLLDRALRLQDLPLAGYQFDPGIADYVLASHRKDHSMDALLSQYLGVSLPPRGEHEQRALAEVTHLPALEERLREELRTLSLEPLFEKVEMPLARVLADMEAVGLALDSAVLRRLDEAFARELADLAGRMYELAGTEFNPDSPAQVGDVLFAKLQLPGGKQTKTGWSTGAEILDDLAEEHEIVRLILQYREYAKLRSTYVKGLLAQINPLTGRIHTTLEQTVTATGRLSSRNPNLQNIPVRTELGREIRAAFVSGAPDRVLLSADYSQIELRLLAHFSRVPSLCEAFQRAEDVHRATAAVIFGLSPEEVTAQNRRIAKTVNFAVIYGQGPGALARQIGVSRAEAEHFIHAYFERLAGVKQYLDQVVQEAENEGFVETLTGRRRYLPELRSGHGGIKAYAQRAAANSPLQGSAAEIMKIAMVRVAAFLDRESPETELLLQVHDELLFSVRKTELDSVAFRVKEIMESAEKLCVPLVVDLKVGPNWRDMNELRH